MNTTVQKVISIEEFEKRVEIEVAHLIYFDRLKKEKALEQARQEISRRFIPESK